MENDSFNEFLGNDLTDDLADRISTVNLKIMLVSAQAAIATYESMTSSMKERISESDMNFKDMYKKLVHDLRIINNQLIKRSLPLN